MKRRGPGWMRWAALGVPVLLCGCAGFFPSTSSTSPATGTSSTGDYAYVVNNRTNTLSEFSVGAGALTLVSGSPLTLTTGLAALSVAVSRSNAFVFVGGNGAISCQTVGSGGALTAVPLTTGGGSATANFVSLETSPDGQWLFGLDTTTLTIYTYKINASTCALTLNATTSYSSPSSNLVAQKMIRIAPNATLVAVALGSAGDLIYTFNTSTGILTLGPQSVAAAGYSDNAVVFGKNSAYVYFARASTSGGPSGVASYSVSSTGALNAVQTLATSGSAPSALQFDGTGAYLYVANAGDGTITGYTAANGALTALGSAPYPSGSQVGALAIDNTGKYVVAAANGGSNDVTFYALDALTPGKLDAVGTSLSGADPAGSVAVAATHGAGIN